MKNVLRGIIILGYIVMIFIFLHYKIYFISHIFMFFLGFTIAGILYKEMDSLEKWSMSQGVYLGGDNNEGTKVKDEAKSIKKSKR